MRYLFFVLKTLNFINSDAAVPGLSRSQAYLLELVGPPLNLLKKFCLIANAIAMQASALENRSALLRRTRDLLLPKLISGEVDVSELDIRVPKEDAA